MFNKKEMMKRMMERAKERGVKLFREDTVEGLQPQEIEEKATEDYVDAFDAQESLLYSVEAGLCNLNEWVEEDQATVYWTSKEEMRITWEGALFEIVMRRLAGQVNVLIEPNGYGWMFLDNGKKVTLDSGDVTPDILEAWKVDRARNWREASICTRMMPAIVATGLRQHYGFDAEECRIMRNKLLLFGTRKFGREGIRFGGEMALEFHTPKYICYAPGELDAILSVAAEMIQEARDVKNVRDLDMTEFTSRLREKASGISPTLDIVLFGRYLNGCGLNEYEGAVKTARTIIL